MATDWEKHKTKQQHYTNLFNNKFLADVKFIFPQPNATNPKILYSHSFVLSIQSAVFHKMFYGPNEVTHCKINDFYEIIIPTMPYSIFSEFINCFYNNLETNKSAINQQNRNRTNNLYCLVKLARDYDVVILEQLLLSYFDKYLKSNINFNTIINTLLISNLVSDRYGKTFERSVTFIKRNLYKFLKMKLARELDRQGLEILLRFDEIDYWTSELDIYRAVLGWAEAQIEFNYVIGNYREVIGTRLMKLIRFPTMNFTQFKHVIGVDAPNVLKENEIRRLFSYISNVSYEHDNEMVDLCGYSHVPRRKIKQWKDYKMCQTFVSYNDESKCCTWCASISVISVLQGLCFVSPYVY